MDPVINYKEFDFRDSTVIKPQSSTENKHDNKKYTRVIVDSRDRNLSFYDTPAQYEISLPEEIEDVIAAELQIIDLPFSAYMIDENNCILHISVNNAEHKQVSIPKGDYTASTLATVIEESAALNNIYLKLFYLVEKDSYRFELDQPFSFFFKGDDIKYNSVFVDSQSTLTYKRGTIAKVIGFGPKIYASLLGPNNKHIITSEFRKNFKENKYIVMHIEQISINQSINSIIHKSFAVIPPKAVDMNLYQVFQIRKSLNPAIAKLNKLKIRFTNYHGQPYDFQNQDHRFDIIFESFQNPRRYQSYFLNS